MLELIQRKSYEVTQLEQKYADPSDPVHMRLEYVADSSSFQLTRSLRLFRLGDERRVSVVADLKRLSPTAPTLPRSVGSFVDAGARANELFDWGVNVVLCNMDETGWGGRPEDLESVVAAKLMRQQRLAKRVNSGSQAQDGSASVAGSGAPSVEKGGGGFTAVVAKDLFIHPLQIAEAVERGADGVLLIACVCGHRLGELLDACTIMGTEALVEVHTPNEAQYALEQGALNLMLNCWDRADGAWHPTQAEAVRRMIPDNVVTVATGGVGSSDQARGLSDVGFDAVCVGRALTLHPDPQRLVKNIRNFQAPPLLMGVNGAD